MESKIDLENFAIDITDPVNAELLPGFMIEMAHVSHPKYKFYGKRRGNRFGSVNNNMTQLKLTTLPELQKQHPGVFGETSKGKDLCGVKLDYSIVCDNDLGNVMKAEECRFVGTNQECLDFVAEYGNATVPQQIEVGDVVRLVSDFGKGDFTKGNDYTVLDLHEDYFVIKPDTKGLADRRFFKNAILKNRIGSDFIIVKKGTTPSFKAGQEVIVNTSQHKDRPASVIYIHEDRAWCETKEGDNIFCFLDQLRPIPAQPTMESPEEELKTILNNAYRKGEWGSYLDQEILAWHQKHSGRVEVSDSEILEYWRSLPSYSTEGVTATVRHFMTRKEQQG